MRFSRTTLLGDKPAGGYPEVTYAGFVRRGASLLVDSVLFFAFGSPALTWAHGQPIESAFVCHAHWGRTLGKMLAGIKVRRLDGGTIGYREATLRSAVDLALALVASIALGVTMSQWSTADWSSLPHLEKMTLIAERDPTTGVISVMGVAWFWSELVVLLFNDKRRAIHDYIAGTVVVVE